VKASIVIPVLYDEPQLAVTLSRLTLLRGGDELEILMVVDVPDPSREAASRAANDSVASRVGATVLYRVGRRGFGSALRHGFAHASGDAMIPFMGDACDDPEDIPRLLAKVAEGWDVVAGSRYMSGGRIRGNTLKQRMSRLYGWLVRMAGGPPIHDVSNAFKAYAASVVRSVDTAAESYDVSVELTVKAYRAGFRVTEIPTTWTNRELGESNWRFTRELRRYSRWLLLAATPRSRAPRDAPTSLPARRSSEGT
jgi:glycosyltransferase involved in cell wall biosynthesis